jgi:UDP-N-acetylglucosamine 2-epimerase (non-hydrolysing)
MRNLHNEGVSPKRTKLTGNPAVSAIRRYTDATWEPRPRPVVLVTMHRREWLEKGPEHVYATIAALESVAHQNPQVRFVWPMHPAVWRMGLCIEQRPEPSPSNVEYTEPLPYKEAVELLATSLGVATDSGGLQEEAGTLGVPCAVLRNVTDRPESIIWGTAALFEPSPKGMIRALEALIARDYPRDPTDAYGEPDSALKIARILRAFGSSSGDTSR